MAMQLRDIQVSPNGRFIIGATWEKQLLITNALTLETTSFPCDRWDVGGSRVLVADDGARFFTGAYHVHGVTAWRFPGPAELWQRKDLKKVQHLALSSDGALLLASLEGRGTFLLRANSGMGCGHWRGVTSVIPGPEGLFARAGRRLDLCVSDGTVIGAAPRNTFGVLAGAFGASLVCISEAAGPVSFFATASFQEVWRYVPPAGSHVLEVGFRARTNTFVGIQWEYANGGPYRIIELAPSRQAAFDLRVRSADGDVAFCLGAESLYTASGVFESLTSSSEKDVGA